ncbi:MAG: DUF3137 domain-containing protein [Pseudomonadales bacterium]
MLADIYEPLEQQRVAAVKSAWKARALTLLLVPMVFLPVAALIFTMTYEQFSGMLADLAVRAIPWLQDRINMVMVALIGWVIGGLWLVGKYYQKHVRQPIWAYISQYKTRVFEQLCNKHFPDLRYDANGYIGYDTFDGMQLFNYQSDWYRSEDYFGGQHGKTRIHFAEVHAKRERKRLQDGRIHKYDETFFKGLVFVADFHKHFHCTARLVPTGEKVPRIRSQASVTFEDPDFNERFKTLASDQTDIRYILSTSMMQRMMRLDAQFPGLRAMFSNDRLTLMLPNARDRFEPSIYKRANSIPQIEGLVKEIQELINVVEELDLNTRIWSKS